ncbi:MAG: hypothetical protein EA387_00560, partial [Nitriliruptor sp.]
FLLRHGRVFREAGNWTAKHTQWLNSMTFDEPAAQATFVHYRAMLQMAEASGGWIVEYPSGHWGRLYCRGDRSGDRCTLAISGTPKGSGHFKTIQRKLRNCTHGHALA